MTRINCIPPSELVNVHLLAEYKELPRIFTGVKKYVSKNDYSFLGRIPESYRMGSGHVLFFYDKLSWLSDRYRDLVTELNRRGYNLNTELIDSVLSGAMQLPDTVQGTWCPDNNAMAINRERITERLSKE